jgi:hypothetical protein
LVEVKYIGPHPSVTIDPELWPESPVVAKAGTIACPDDVGASLAEQSTWELVAANPFSSTYTKVPSVFARDATSMARLSSAEIAATNYAQKAANQLLYTLKAQENKYFGYSGLGKGGSSGEGNQVVANWKSFTPTLYVVPKSQPRSKVWLVKSNTSEEVRSKAEDPFALQGRWESVPLPTSSLLSAFGEQLWPEGSDKEIIVWCPATGEYWEFWGFSKFASGEHAGEYKAGFGGYLANAATSNGVLPNNWGARASGLAAAGGSISLSDLTRVLNGGKIGHALSVALVVTKGPANSAALLPATRNDTHENTAGTSETNPAFGAVDAVPEGTLLTFPKESSASEYMSLATEPLSCAAYEAVREHGMYVADTSITSAAFYVADARTLGTIYCDTNRNPYAGWKGAEPTATTVNTEINNKVPGVEAAAAAIKESFLGTKSLFAKWPVRNLEQVIPTA